jgi:hypothetical protein
MLSAELRNGEATVCFLGRALPPIMAPRGQAPKVSRQALALLAGKG